MTTQVFPFTLDVPPVVCDWLPWKHTFGGGQVIGMFLRAGGSIYIDDGRALPREIEKSIVNLKDVRPIFFIGVPAYFEMVLPFLKDDSSFCSAFTPMSYSTAAVRRLKTCTPSDPTVWSCWQMSRGPDE